jgi:hypothetical protein
MGRCERVLGVVVAGAYHNEEDIRTHPQVYNADMISEVLKIPFRLTAVCIVVLYTLLVRYCQFAVDPITPGPLMMLNQAIVAPLWYIAFATLALYTSKWMVHVARGLVAHPLDGETDINPFMTLRPVRLGLFFFAIAGVWLTHGSTPTPWLVGLGLLVTYLWLGLVLEDSMFRGLNPRHVWHLTAGSAYLFPVIAGLVAGGSGLLVYVALWKENVLLVGGSAFVFLAAQSLAAWLVFVRRNEMGLFTAWSPEQEVAAEAMNEARAQDDLLESLAERCARGQFGEAYAKLNAYIATDYAHLDPVMHDRLARFDHPQLFLEHSVHYLHRLYDAGERRKAWAILSECVAVDEDFRPMDAETLFTLTRFARAGDARLVDLLLGDFERDYPDSELIADALFRRARVLIELLNYKDRGIPILERIVEEFKEFHAIEEVRGYLAKTASPD